MEGKDRQTNQDNFSISKKPGFQLLGDLLLKRKLITKQNLEKALQEQKKTGQLLGEILIEKGYVEEKELLKILAEQLDVEYCDLSEIKISPDLVSIVPESIARVYLLVPVRLEENVLTVAMVEPQNIFAIDELRAETGLIIRPALSSKEQIIQALDTYYGRKNSLEKMLTVVTEESPSETEVSAHEEIEEIRQSAEKAPIVRLVDAIITDAVKSRASDIHIEPARDFFKVRFRIDGILHDITTSPKYLYRAVISRIKIMSNIDIAEKRKPQDGGFRVDLEGNIIDVRTSTYPSIYGEKAVLRLLSREKSFLDLAELGFEPEELETFVSLIKRPCGIILVVGPTGSGKSTTLYSVLSKINSPEKNIITIEDPVEYKIEGITQSQVNVKAGLTFSNSLRSMMRQDPDVIMVGEIRDLETAQLAVRASLTGHLVFSTLHTNDAPSTITRLVNMGVEPYLVASSLLGVVAQRLVRLICPRCKEEIEPSPFLLEEFKDELNQIGGGEPKFYKGRGCEFCRNTGYRGREGVFELMVVAGEEMLEAISSGTRASILRNLAKKQKMRTLKENGLRKVLKGKTTLEEALRITQIV